MIEKHKTFDRRAIIARELWDAERDLAYTTRWLADPLPLAVANRDHFLDWRWDANDRYARALRLAARLRPEAAKTQQLTLF